MPDMKMDRLLTLFFGAVFFTSCLPGRVFDQPNVSQLPADEYLEKLEASEDHYLIDVRTRMEFKKAHLEGAMNNSYIRPGFGRRIRDLDPSKPVFLYCETAHRSPYAARKLFKKGFDQIYDLEGGYRILRKRKQNDP
jgi:rhodanese-related sulfurtransferase